MQLPKLTQVGNSVGVILPKEPLTKLRGEKGNSVYVTETPEGSVLTPMTCRSASRSKPDASSCATTTAQTAIR